MPVNNGNAVPGLEGTEVTRRRFLSLGAQAGIGTVALAATSSSFLAACSKDNKSKLDSQGTPGKDTLKVGVVAPFSGVGAFIGTITNSSLEAAVKQLNSTGGIGGRKVELVLRDTGAETTAGPKVYTELAADKDVIGVLWCGGLGFTQTLPQIKRDGTPLVAVFNDAFSAGRLFPEGEETGRSVFQILLPDLWAKEVLAKYAAEDRGYKTVAHMYDTVLDAEGDALKRLRNLFPKAGIEVVASETYTLDSSDYGPQLQRIKAKKPHIIYVDGFSGNTAGIVKQLASLGAEYRDKTAVLGGGEWHPHVFGSPGGAGDKSWVELAGDAAKVGTVTAWHVGGLISLPTFAIGKWMEKFLSKKPTGGEESPADGLATLLEGVKRAGSTERAKLPVAIESMGEIKFASIPFSYTRDRHVSKTKDDVIVVTMERGSQGPAQTDPPYQLGKEWARGGAFEDTPAGPTHLVRPTLAANRRAHPDVIKQVLDDGYGTQCTKKGETLTPDCKIH